MILTLPTNYYQQFSGDTSKPYPAESYGGWKRADLPIDTETTAFVSMHAWDTGEDGEFPGWERCVEYIPRASRICRELTAPFLDKVRKAGMRIIHVAAPGQTYAKYPGYQKTLDITGPAPDVYGEALPADGVVSELRSFKSKYSFVGDENAPDVNRGHADLDFNKYVRPKGDEHVVVTSNQLFGLCRHYNIHHLIYTGFAINMCLVSSPGGMIDMSRRGIFCSSVRELTAAVENRESNRGEKNKEYGLWYDALLFGCVYNSADLEKYVLDPLADKK